MSESMIILKAVQILLTFAVLPLVVISIVLVIVGAFRAETNRRKYENGVRK